MAKRFFPSESATEGHPGKACGRAACQVCASATAVRNTWRMTDRTEHLQSRVSG